MYSTEFYYVEDDWCYVRIPKNASTTILRGMGINYGDCISYKDVDWSKIKRSFAVVRNPLDRILSCYQNRIINHHKMNGNPELVGKTLPQFINAISMIDDDYADSHFRSQSWFIDKAKNVQLIKLDRLQENWNLIESMTNKVITYRVLKYSPSERLKPQLNTKLHELIKKRYKEDFKLYNSL